MDMADNTNTGGTAEVWNLNIPPEAIATAGNTIGETFDDIRKTYSAINEEIGVILTAWSGQAADLHIKLYNEDALVFNAYDQDMGWEATRLNIVAGEYDKSETRSTERSGGLSGNIF